MGPLAREIRRRRRALSLTQEQAAQAADVSISTWGNLEAGRQTDPSPTTAAGVARALGWPSDFLARIEAGGSPEAAGQPLDGPELLATLRDRDPEAYAAVLTLMRSLARRYES